MKRLLMVLSLLLSATPAWAAVAPFRVDINGLGKEGKIKLTAVQEPGSIKLVQQTYRPAEDRPFTLTGIAAKPAEDWTEYSFAFKAGEAGTVNFQFRANKMADKGDISFVQVANPRVNGDPLPNADFKETEKDAKTKKLQPKGYTLSGDASLLEGAGPDGVNAVKINHDHRLVFTMEVGPDKVYTFKVLAKNYPDEPAAQE